MPERAAAPRSPLRRTTTPVPATTSSAAVPPAGGTVLAFDYGERRVGVAVGDLGLRSAHPLVIVTARGAARLEAIARLIDEWRPVALVVGIPVAEQGAHPLAARVEAFAQRLAQRFALPVARVDERYSSSAAEQRLRDAAGARRAARASRERTLDALAAQLLLEQYHAERGP